MSSRVDAVLAKLAATGAEPSPEGNTDASPAGASSGDGSALANGRTASSAPVDDVPLPSATVDKDELRAKLDADKNRRLTKRDRFLARRERERAEEVRKKAEETAKEAEAKRAKWANIGKDMPIAEVLREAGRDPNEVFEAMRAEALKAGTPEAKIEALQKAYDAKIAIIEKNAADEKEARESERKRLAAEAKEARFESDFRRTIDLATYEPLLDEYQPRELYTLAQTLRDNPPYVAKLAKDLKVDLTADDGNIYIQDIMNVMLARQAEHRAYQEQRRKEKAAPPSSETVQQPPSAKRVTVNGAEERKAGSTIGNDLASGRGGVIDRSEETRSQRMKRMIAEGKG